MKTAPVRVDYWLRQRYPELTRRHIDEALANQLVRSASGAQLAKGAMVANDLPPDCSPLEQHLAIIRAGNPQLQIPVLHVSAALLAIDKPAGMPSHPISLFDDGTVTNWAIARYPEVLQWAKDCQPTITPHRLDTDTSGVLLVARTSDAYELWRRRFSEKKVMKHYLAWCWGQGPTDDLLITSGIAHDPRDRRKMLVAGENGSPHRRKIFAAATAVRMCRQLQDRFLCELTMHTGVTHQIRVHLASTGNPLLGDRLYDSKYENRCELFSHTLLRCTGLQYGEFSVAVDPAEFTGRFQG